MNERNKDRSSCVAIPDMVYCSKAIFGSIYQIRFHLIHAFLSNKIIPIIIILYDWYYGHLKCEKDLALRTLQSQGLANWIGHLYREDDVATSSAGRTLSLVNGLNK